MLIKQVTSWRIYSEFQINVFFFTQFDIFMPMIVWAVLLKLS